MTNLIQHHIKAGGMQKGELKRRIAQRAPKESSGRTFFSKLNLTRLVPCSCTASRQATPATTGTAGMWEKFAATNAQHLPQQEIQRTGLSVQAPSSTNNETLKVATTVQQIITELREAVSEKDKIMFITN
jgi:hypothetical protein